MSDGFIEHDLQQVVEMFQGALGVKPSVWQCGCGTCTGAVAFAMADVPRPSPYISGLKRDDGSAGAASARAFWVMGTSSTERGRLPVAGMESSTELEALFVRMFDNRGLVPLEHVMELAAAMRRAASELYS